ncbi:unnamed protein product, partial [Callosobruchus maculatus]
KFQYTAVYFNKLEIRNWFHLYDRFIPGDNFAKKSIHFVSKRFKSSFIMFIAFIKNHDASSSFCTFRHLGAYMNLFGITANTMGDDFQQK